VRDILPRGACEIIALDRYYRDLSHLSPGDRATANFDHPDAIDWPLLKRNIFALSEGQWIAAPSYDFVNHVRRAETVEIPSAPILIVEGILALWDDDLNARAGLRIFIDIPDEACFQRRNKRDVAERGRSVDSVRAQFQATVQPMAELFVRPTQRNGDVVLDGREPIAALVNRLLGRIPQQYHHNLSDKLSLNSYGKK
jgi:uridine kinase